MTRALFEKGLTLVALLIAALGLVASAAKAQTVDNIAQALWQEDGQLRQRSSNKVSLSVQPLTRISVLRAARTTSGERIFFKPSMCAGGAIEIPGQSFDGFSASTVEETNKAFKGEVLYLRSVNPALNRDSYAIDTITMTVTTGSGDSERLTVYETGLNSGVFIGALPTAVIPPSPVSGDCKLSVASGDRIVVAVQDGTDAPALGTSEIVILADPYGMIFDSETGEPIDGIKVTLVDANSGTPARVFAEDGRTPWPSSVVSGQTIIDSAGRPHAVQSGEFLFPLVARGSYRLVLEPPAPLIAPSRASEAEVARLVHPDGHFYSISPASFGKEFRVETDTPLQIDIPVDIPPTAVMVNKTISRSSALPGDIVIYTITVRNPDRTANARGVTVVDAPSAHLRFRPDTVRIGGARPAEGIVQFAPDGSKMTIALGDIAAGGARTITYAMSVRANANAGQAENRVTAASRKGPEAVAATFVRIEQEDIAARMTLLGRVIAGGCTTPGKGQGVAGVRIVMEDGSFAVTDANGRYHFQGVMPGNHVLQAIPSTLPAGSRFVDCARSTRSAGSAISRFVSGQGGSAVSVDFHADVPATALKLPEAPVAGTTGPNPVAKPAGPTKDIAVAAGLNREELTDEERRKRDDADSRRAAGADTDWMAMGAGPTEFLFPKADHNPRAPAVRVVIRHRPDEKIELLAEGKPVETVSLDSVTNSKDGRFTISIWRGVPLKGEDTLLTANVRDTTGKVTQTLSRNVHFAKVPARVELIEEKSRLIADGSTRPVIALRLLDRVGLPVHSGLSGNFALSAPYESLEALEARQSRSITGSGLEAPRWFVRGDDGIAYVELAPTMVSGKLRMEFQFTDGQSRRKQEIESWIAPGKQPWTVVGLAEAGVGSRDIADAMQRTKPFDSDLGDNARIAFYMKGQIGKGFLITGAYDSAKQREEQRLMGSVDPRAYYTVFADNSDRRNDAASRDKMYLRLEGKGFSGFYGDFEAGFDQSQLSRYHRAATGIRAEATSGRIQAAAFAARVRSTHRRDEIQGAGITGPYRLSSRSFIAGSDVVSLEVRDRFRSEVIVSRKPLTRFVDYEIDVLSGTISFRQPLLSRDEDLNPQFVIIDYELGDNVRGGPVNAGVRTAYTTKDGKVRVGVTGLTDTGSNQNTRTNLAGIDARARIGQNTEVRAEVARSSNDGQSANAWLVEAEHHSGKVDVLTYARSADMRFGVGQMSGAERGRRKLGVDARYRTNENLSFTASAWNDTSLDKGGTRNAVQVGANFRSDRTDGRIGLSSMRDSIPGGTTNSTTTLDLSASRRLFDNKLEIGAATSLAITKAKATDLPNRHRLSLRYAITQDIRVVGTYEIAKGEKTNTRTARGGVEVTPWTGGRITTALSSETNADGKRALASVGVSQSMQLTPRLTADMSVESARTIGGLYARRFNADQPNSSGGTLGDNASLAGDFTAVSLGASWRGGRWVLNGRGEWRKGNLETRRGIQFSVIRQMGEGSMLGGTFSFGHTRTAQGSTSRVINSALALAYRPAGAPIGMLGKLEIRSDKLDKALPGEEISGNALTVDGNAMSTRVIGSFAFDWNPYGEQDGNFYQRSELSMFGAVRYNFDNYADMTLAGTTLLSGIDARLGLGEHFDVGGRATVRASLSDGTTNYSSGPEVGVSPTRDVLLTFGYNVTGYYDRDFTAAKFTNQGPYAGIRLKFDASSFALFD